MTNSSEPDYRPRSEPAGPLWYNTYPGSGVDTSGRNKWALEVAAQFRLDCRGGEYLV
jgi:hypothetical protein